ncbi:AAA family ATPase [Allorhodopirellula heiligendammensis]|nr:ATP-binding protein [Allorhodopirellula heiligendammensis]
MIHEIRIQNFKSIRNVTVEFTPVTVLIGRSGTGKSNFIEAIRYLRDLLGADWNGMGGGVAGMGSGVLSSVETIRPLPKTNAPTRFEIFFSVRSEKKKYRYLLDLGKTPVEGGIGEEKLCLGENVLFHQSVDANNQAIWKVEPRLVEVPAPGGVALGRMPSLSEVVVAYVALTEGIGCYSFPRSVMLDGAKSEAGQFGFQDAGSNYLQTMRKIVSNFQDSSARQRILSSLQRVIHGVSSVELNDLRQPQYAVVGHLFNRLTLELKLSQESEGFRRFFAHLLALNQQPSKLAMFFEHPEEGVHPSALSLLVDDFLAAPEDGRGQVILTTHSPELLDRFDADQIQVVEKEGFFTQIGELAMEQREALDNQLTEPGELLTVDPARLEDALESTVHSE